MICFSITPLRRSSHAGRLLFGVTAALGLAFSAQAQTFLLDDRPAAPLLGFPGFGDGAESPWGFPTVPGAPVGPSPVLPGIPGIVVGDGDFLTPGLAVTASPGLPYMASISDSPPGGAAGFAYHVYFSVDRVTTGVAGSAVSGQATLNQHAGDVFRGGSTFVAPATLIGTMAARPAPFAGNLGAALTNINANALDADESTLTLPADAGGAVIGPGVPAAPLGNGTHNNVDGFDFAALAAGGAVLLPTYLTTYPDITFPLGIATPNIFDLSPGSTSFCGRPAYATAPTMGLGFGDVIDAMVVLDTAPRGSVACGGIGAQPGVDAILFSLAPGSPSLLQTGQSASDVFFSDFSGNFGVYAAAGQIGLQPNPGGGVGTSGDNVDGMEFGCLGDLNHDGKVNSTDFSVLAGCFFATPGCADFNFDGITNFTDLTIMQTNLGCSGG